MGVLIETLDDDGVLWLRLNEPRKKNALTDELRAALRDALQWAQDDPDVRAIVVAGTEGAFSAGGDISAMTGDPDIARARMEILHDVVRLLLAGNRPTVAAVSGVAFGAGFSLALCCDQVIADPSARFSASFGKVGLPPDLGLAMTLPGRIGQGAARRILLSSSIVEAEEAGRLGIADMIVPATELDARAKQVALDLAGFSQEAKGHVKALLTASAGDLDAMLDREMSSYITLLNSEEHTTARDTFLARSASR
ncbi:MAG: enoyl-CoA hydratase-related protein [Pseudomonadota bacterium]|nr:enoyl-CoA hydratase-related protein [Pseudomonadota bacterium]